MFQILKDLFKRFHPANAETPIEGGELSEARLSRHGTLNLEAFSAKFVAANIALTKGNTEGLKEGLGLLADSLADAGKFAPEVIKGIAELRCGLSHHDRADTKGPWNRDLSGYGVTAWKNDLYDRDSALLRAWSHLEPINRELLASGLGWKY